jgi:gliding motility-associated-like protein
MSGIKLLATSFLITLSSYLSAQIATYQDVFKGGVTGDAFNAWNITIGGNFDIYIEPGSSIRKAFLFVSVYNSPDPVTLYFNNSPIVLNSQNTFNNDAYYIYNSNIRRIRTLMMDVNPLVHPSQLSYPVSALNQSATLLPGIYCEYYLYVAYENPNLQEVCANVYVNNIQPNAHMPYNFSNLNPMNTTSNIGLAINGSNMCDTIADGSYVKVDGTTIGLIGGQDDGGIASCTGVMGSFFYQNQTLFGLSNDVANTTMLGTDAIANIETYLNTTTSFNLDFDYQSNLGPKTNPINQIFLTYTTPCDTFSASLLTEDTVVCRGQTIQLGASGGNVNLSKPAYEWLPQQDLSCYDCPNPIFSGDSSRVYTVRIWNTDSCSKVLPVRVKVLPTPQFTSISVLPTACGFSNGKLAVTSTSATDSLLVNNLVVGKLPVNLANLGAGQYTLSIKDAKGCFSQDTVVVLPALPSVHAFFSLNPQQGAAPLTVHSNNQSTGANLYEWQFQNTNSTQTEPVFTFDTAGTYIVTLIANNNTPACADTFSLSVWVYDSLQVHIPNIITPNNDGTNDWFSIQVNAPITGSVSILNRWGNTVYSSDVKANNKGTIKLWDGKTNQQEVVEGTYFYRFQLTYLQGKELEMHGFVEVVR